MENVAINLFFIVMVKSSSLLNIKFIVFGDVIKFVLNIVVQ